MDHNSLGLSADDQDPLRSISDFHDGDCVTLKFDELLAYSDSSSGRNSESSTSIYQHTANTMGPIRDGLAKFKIGGDVLLPHFPEAEADEAGRDGVISARSLRGDADAPEPDPSDIILHRLVLDPIGRSRSMWWYDSDEQLLKAFRDVVMAHEALCKLGGLLHRDISPGNILLNIGDGEEYGILTDMDSARLSNPTMRSPSVITEVVGDSQTRTHIVFDAPSDVERGAIMTGTVQFMAMELLRGYSKAHEAKHDIESLIWSFVYCVWRKLNRLILDGSAQGNGIDSDQRNLFTQMFMASFSESQTAPDEIATQRLAGSLTLLWVLSQELEDIVKAFVAPPLVGLFMAFSEMLSDSQEIPTHNLFSRKAKQPKIPLTHEILLEAIDMAISRYM